MTMTTKKPANSKTDATIHRILGALYKRVSIERSADASGLYISLGGGMRFYELNNARAVTRAKKIVARECERLAVAIVRSKIAGRDARPHEAKLRKILAALKGA